MERFADRVEAGQALAARLEHLRGRGVVVVGLPRGGVPVAAVVAEALDAPLDVVVVRKLGVPWQPELAMGAIGEGGARVVDTRVVTMAGVTEEELRVVEEHERAVLQQRVALLRGGRPRLELTGRTVVVVDDGIATGSTARAACEVVRGLGATRVVLAVPVAPTDTVRDGVGADELVCVRAYDDFVAVGNHYRDFSATTDDEVVRLLDAAERRRARAHALDPDHDVRVPAGAVELRGHLRVPPGARALVLFAHGSGSSRHSPRNRFVASVLQDAGIGTLLFDLLTTDEEVDRATVFDIELLAERLTLATQWVRTQDETADLVLGYFGASTGAAAALWAAADPASPVAAVVSRGGRPDLAGPRLGLVRVPTLLIVGSHDDVVLGLNRRAQTLLRCPSELAVVPGATHLFEEPGTLAEAASLASDFFVRHLVPAPAGATH